jgi:hypothetical protein
MTTHPVDVSVCVSTFRPAGIEITLAGMRDQSFAKNNFEVVIADRRYEKRHAEVMALAKKYGVTCIHVPEHRRNGQWNVFCSAWNTAFALARGRVVILCQDWAYCPPGWIETHLQHHEVPGRYVVGPYFYMQVPPLHLKKDFDFTGQRERGGYCIEADSMLKGDILDEMFAFQDGPFDPAWLDRMGIAAAPHQDSRIRPQGPGVPETYVHVKNESILRKTLYNLNGLDERMERGKGPMDLELGMRMVENGIVLWWEQSAIHMVPNPRAICRTMPFGDMHERVEGRWSYDEGTRYIARRRGEIMTHGGFRALNPYDLYDLAKELEPWRTAETIDVGPLEQTDEQYWKEKHPLWWDTP